jgi:prolipoprotein diacylglyceryltransferase
MTRGRRGTEPAAYEATAAGRRVLTCQHRGVPVVGSIPSPSFNGIHVGPFDIRIYGLCYVLAVLAAVAITARRWEAQGGSRELVQEVAPGLPAGTIGGRLWPPATSWNEVPDRWGPFAVWEGPGIWGRDALGTAWTGARCRARADVRFLTRWRPRASVAAGDCRR